MGGIPQRAEKPRIGRIPEMRFTLRTTRNRQDLHVHFFRIELRLALEDLKVGRQHETRHRESGSRALLTVQTVARMGEDRRRSESKPDRSAITRTMDRQFHLASSHRACVIRGVAELSCPGGRHQPTVGHLAHLCVKEALLFGGLTFFPEGSRSNGKHRPLRLNV